MVNASFGSEKLWPEIQSAGYQIGDILNTRPFRPCRWECVLRRADECSAGPASRRPAFIADAAGTGKDVREFLESLARPDSMAGRGAIPDAGGDGYSRVVYAWSFAGRRHISGGRCGNCRRLLVCGEYRTNRPAGSVAANASPFHTRPAVHASRRDSRSARPQ